MAIKVGGLVRGLWLGLILLPLQAARANDTNAVMAAGGLSFVETKDLRIDREDLFLSPDKVTVAYRISNLTSHDIHTLIAFPLPDIDVSDLSEVPHEFHPSAHSGDIVNFKLTINGQPMETAFDAHAYRRDESGKPAEDVTALLQRYHVALADSGGNDHSDVWDSIDHLGPAAIKTLTAAKVLYDDDEHHPNWVVKAAYHWEQTFPAGQTVVVEHRYQPVLGGSSWSPGEFRTPSENTAAWCFDKGFIAAVEKLPTLQGSALAVSWLGYILKTGANWAGPIRQFHLDIAKDDYDLLSLCPIPGLSLHRQGASFVADARDFTPTSDITILFVRGKGKASP